MRVFIFITGIIFSEFAETEYSYVQQLDGLFQRGISMPVLTVIISRLKKLRFSVKFFAQFYGFPHLFF